MNLEVGKKYRSRCGEVWTCDSECDDEGYAFRCRKLDSVRVTLFTADGHYYSFCNHDEDDLIEEFIDEPVTECRHIDTTADDYTPTGTELRRDMLRQVESCVCANRQNTYGDAEDNFANIAALANVALQGKLAAPIEAEDVAIFSICIKLARLIQSPEHLDNWIDLAGYAVCGGGIMKRKELNAKAIEADATV